MFRNKNVKWLLERVTEKILEKLSVHSINSFPKGIPYFWDDSHSMKSVA